MAHDYQGVNYTIDIQRGVGLHCIFSRPDITFDQGAQAADEMREVHLELTSRADIRGLVLDMRKAPSMGPKTRAYFGELFQSWCQSTKRIGVVLDHEQAILVMQLRKIIADSAPKYGRIAHDIEDAFGWVNGSDSPSLVSGMYKVPSPTDP